MPVRADPAEAERFLAEHPHVDAIDLVFTNLAGVARGKRLRRHELLPFYRNGRFLPGSLLVNDVRGDDVPETGLVWGDGDADRLAWPAPGTLAAMPWAGAGAAQVIASLYELDGTPCALDPRTVLARTVADFAADGLTPVVACELEFYLLDPAADPPRPALGAVHPQVYGLAELARLRPFLDAVNRGCDSGAIRVEAAIAENAPGQVEIGLTHHADALRACDEAVLFKRVVRGCAAAHGLRATFMAKPFADIAGSGLHVHMSMADREGRNVFAADAPEGTPALGHAVAGMAALMSESMLIFAPNANSYRRFRAGSYAPVAPSWGVNNRTVALRVPAGPPASRHVEHRLCGADANPYLAVAAILAAARHGMSTRLDPCAAVVGNGYEQAPRADLPPLPRDWPAAIAAWEAGEVLPSLLTPHLVRTFATVKRHEYEAYAAIVPREDHLWYADVV